MTFDRTKEKKRTSNSYISQFCKSFTFSKVKLMLELKKNLHTQQKQKKEERRKKKEERGRNIYINKKKRHSMVHAPQVRLLIYHFF